LSKWLLQIQFFLFERVTTEVDSFGGVGCLSSELLPAVHVYIPERQKKILKLLIYAYINSVKFAAITTIFPI
jgi:hypothetical protein